MDRLTYPCESFIILFSMRLPIRRSEKLKIHHDDGPLYITKEGLEKLKRKLERLERTDLPQAIQDTRTTAEQGDFSENAEYQEAKGRMRRLHTQIFNLREKIKQAVLIESNASELVCIGSSVSLEKNGTRKTFHIVGPHEADPSMGRISHLSPLGSSLMGHKVGDLVNGFIICTISPQS